MVSIIVPAYNSERYLVECLESAVAQTYRDIEVIVVDDGSSDSTLSIAEGFAERDSRVRFFHNCNGGQSSARNFGVDCARGEYITFLDSDDVLYPEAIEFMYECACRENSELVICHFSQGERPYDLYSHKKKTQNVRKLPAWEVIKGILYQNGFDSSPWAKLYSRRIFENVRFTEGIIYEDLDFIYKAVDEVGHVVVADKRVYFYRYNPDSTVNVFTPRRFDVLDVTRRSEEYMLRHYPELLPAARDRRLSANFNMFGMIAVHDSTHVYGDIAGECWGVIKNYRKESLFNPSVRLKNKLGIIVSYCGRRTLAFFSRIIYRI